LRTFVGVVKDHSLVFDEGDGGVGCAEGFEGSRDKGIDCGFGEVVFG
jgi:hypothetical protein